MTEPQQNSQDPDKYVKELSKILLVLKKAKKEEVDKQRERIIELVKEIEKSNLHKRVLEFWKEVEYSENPELKSALGWESQKSAETNRKITALKMAVVHRVLMKTPHPEMKLNSSSHTYHENRKYKYI